MTKTELEEAGLETDGMAESVSQLQAKLKALTHGKVDIMIDANTFKSTTAILKEMASAWKDMTDIERASALELMGGKRQANILSSVITNFQTVEDVIQTSMDSSGSAIAENEKYLDSIQGRLDLFSNSLQKFWSNMLDSEVIKTGVDFGTSIINLLDTACGKVIALVAAVKLMAKFKGFSLKGIRTSLVDSIRKITTAQQTLQVLGQTTKIGQGYDLTNIQAYAQAVSNLTAKQQANLLASQGLNQEQIRYAMTLNKVDEVAAREAMAHVHAATAKKQEAISGSELVQQKALEVAVSLRTQAAKDGETRSTELNAAADILEQTTSKNLTKDKLVEIMTSKGISSATQAEILAKLGLTNANYGLAASIKAIYMANPIGFWITAVSTVLTLIPVIGSVIDAFTKSADEIKQEAKDIVQTYEDAAEEINNNLKTLTTSSDTNLYATLEDEFATLAAGVDKYGNNISLTSDQYERYKSICNDIVSIQPRIADGYDSATEAIGNQVSILTDLIELQKQQARYNAEQRINDDSLGTIVKDAKNDLTTARMASTRANYTNKGQIWSIFKQMYSNRTKIVGEELVGYDDTDILKEVATTLGYTSDEIAKIVEKYSSDVDGIISVNTTQFIVDYYDEIKSKIGSFGSEYTNAFNDAFTDIEKAIRQADKDVSKAQDALVDDFLVVPYAEDAGEYFEGLNNASRKFVVDWIKNGSQFKADENTTKEQAIENREKIIDMIEDIYSGDIEIEYDGQTFTAQDFLDQVYNLDPSTIPWGEYKQKQQAFLDAFWAGIGADENIYGITKQDLFVSFGIQFINNEDTPGSKQDEVKNQVGEMIGQSADEIQEWLNTLPAIKVQRFYEIQWNKVDNSGVKSFNDVEALLDGKTSPTSVFAAPKTYSTLSSSADSLNEVQQQTAEIFHNGIEVTKEYKDALLELGISSTELAECFDETNPLIVKNAFALQQLVEGAEASAAANVKLAKSQARLKYIKLVKELNQITSSNKELTSEQLAATSVILSQIDAVEQAIYKYTLLEDQLLGTHNAFTKFNEAKEVDSLNTYTDSYVEMAQAIYDAYNKTGLVGTDAVNAAVEALIDPSRLASFERGSEAYNQAVNDIFSKEILPTFTLDGDSLSIDANSIERFVQSGLGKIFDGTSTSDFSLKDTILIDGEEVAANLTTVAKAMGMTETQAYAMLAALKAYTGFDFLSALDDSTEGQIVNTTQKLEQLNKQKIELLANGGYEENKEQIEKLNLEIEKLLGNLDALKERSKNDLIEYESVSGLMSQLDGLGDLSKVTKEQLQNAFTDTQKQQLIDIGINLEDDDAQTVMDKLHAKLLELEEPTVVTVQYAIEYNEEKIEDLKAQADTLSKRIAAAERIGDFELASTLKLDEEELQRQIGELQRQNAEWEIKFNIPDEETVMQSLQSIEEFKIAGKSFSVTANDYASAKLQNIINKIKAIKDTALEIGATITVKGGAASLNGTAHALGTALKSGSWGAKQTETALVGELGPELLVRGNRWTTIGDNGAEFTQVKKGDIIE